MPDVVQIDGFRGRCLEYYEQMYEDNPNAAYFVHSGLPELQRLVEEAGLKFFLEGESPSVLLDYVAELAQTPDQ